MIHWRRWIWWLVAGFVLCGLTWIALGHRGSASDSHRFRVFPFAEMFAALGCVFSQCSSARIAFRYLLINGLGNIVVFAPFGASSYAALGSQRFPTWQAVTAATLIGLAVSTIFETAQIWIPGRVVALDDVILNTIGAFVGAAAAYLIHCRKNSARKTPHPL